MRSDWIEWIERWSECRSNATVWSLCPYLRRISSLLLDLSLLYSKTIEENHWRRRESTKWPNVGGRERHCHGWPLRRPERAVPSRRRSTGAGYSIWNTSPLSHRCRRSQVNNRRLVANSERWTPCRDSAADNWWLNHIGDNRGVPVSDPDCYAMRWVRFEQIGWFWSLRTKSIAKNANLCFRLFSVLNYSKPNRWRRRWTTGDSSSPMTCHQLCPELWGHWPRSRTPNRFEGRAERRWGGHTSPAPATGGGARNAHCSWDLRPSGRRRSAASPGPDHRSDPTVNCTLRYYVKSGPLKSDSKPFNWFQSSKCEIIWLALGSDWLVGFTSVALIANTTNRCGTKLANEDMKEIIHKSEERILN